MKLNTQNNPALTAVLLLVLAGAIGFIALELRQRAASPSVVLAASPAAAAGAPVAVPPPPAVGMTREESDRDPFARPPAPPVLPSPAISSPAAASVSAAPLPPLPAAPVAFGLRALPSPTPLSLAASRPAAAPNVPRRNRDGEIGKDGGVAKAARTAADSLRGLRVSAILGEGSRASALVEGGADGPQTVRAGDTIGGLRVVGVQETQITLAGAHGLRTLPLTDAPEGNGLPVQENAHAMP